ncbi:MAG: glycosyltransferase [Clostridia bacterium]|nr:glycosyltransferase [Clostridia bacterium]
MKKHLDIVDGIETIKYGTSDFHRLLSDDNIGFNAENLTVVILSCNRVNATMKLLKSIEQECVDFKGKVIIADNGSTEESLSTLKKELKNIKLDCKLIEFNENLGVAKGRNTAVKYVETDWIMFLDNDIYFIKNLFPEIQKSIAKLGCKFLNLPLLSYDKKTLFSNGGHIYISDLEDVIHVGCGSTYKQASTDDLTYVNDSLATFLFGGSSVLNKDVFLECGGFDEGMFVGFEDVDFSITLFNKGYKIGCCKEIGLVHDHQMSNDVNDLEYEKQRFSNKRLFESAQYFMKKRGFTVWSKETEEWLKQREKEIGIHNNEDVSQNENICDEKRPKIALVLDCRNWALDNIAKNIEKYLGKYYDFKFIYMSDVPDENIILLLYACLDCDIIHFLWRGYISFIEGKYSEYYLNYYGRGLETFKKDILNKMYITTSVYDHKYLDKDFTTTQTIMKYIKNYTVSSKKLLDTYNNLDIKKPLKEITDGVELELFHPINLDRFKNIKNRKVIIGWVGNSNWNGDIDKDHKGINTIIKPAIEQLQAEGMNIELQCTDKFEKFIPHDEMPNYYKKIDLYICASLNEGTPNPVLESMACGIPVISTDVGIVSEVFGEKQKRFILKERTVECLKESIKEFINNLDNVEDLVNENLKQIQDWSWENKTKEFKEFFDICLKDKNNGGI